MKNTYDVDIIIVGGSIGGCAAALAAAREGKQIILSETTKWIGGQFTNQGVPPDEHPWIEQFGCTQSYRSFRNKIRSYYKENLPVSSETRLKEHFNPGNAIVSNLSHEPRAALAVLLEMLAPYIHNGQLEILSEHKVIEANVIDDEIESIILKDLATETAKEFRALYFLDATDTGELLPLSGTEYITGSESHEDTGEPHALKGIADPLDMQAVTHVLAIDYTPGEDHTIERPKQYDFWKNYQADFWPDLQLSWTGVYPWSLEKRAFTLFPDNEHFSLWEYRRIIAEDHFMKDSRFKDITSVNWPQNDYWLGPVFEVDDESVKKHLEGAKQLSLSLLYWMQTDAPRHDGGYGYPELRLRKDVMGTSDGLAMQPYIRESRRIKACFTVLEQHISAEVRGDQGAYKFKDSVGVGCYRVDLHPSTGNRHYIDFASLPFQIPLGAMIPIRMNNVIPACKNIGTTHITSGCYRLHPVEWNIGEVAGYLVSYALNKGLKPRQIYESDNIRKEFQELLIRRGIELDWPVIHAV